MRNLLVFQTLATDSLFKKYFKGQTEDISSQICPGAAGGEAALGSHAGSHLWVA